MKAASLPSAIAIAIAICLAACSPKSANTPETTTSVPTAVDLAASDIVTAAESSLQSAIPVTGQLQAVHHTTVQSQVAAPVAEVLVREGETVKAGQVLARLSTPDLSARVKQAEAALASAQSQATLAEAVRARNDSLRKDNYLSEIDDKRGQAEAQSAKENVNAQQALLNIARKALNDAVITAPMAGVIARRQVEPGQTLAVNAVLFDLVNLTELELTATVPAGRIAEVQAGQTIRFTVQGYAEPFTGQVARINPVADTVSRAVSVYARVANPQYRLRAGLFVQGRLLTGTAATGISLPLSAVHQDADGSYVWLVSGQKLLRQAVQPGVSDEQSGKVIIISGVKTGDIVVLARLKPEAAGLSVRIGG